MQYQRLISREGRSHAPEGDSGRRKGGRLGALLQDRAMDPHCLDSYLVCAVPPEEAFKTFQSQGPSLSQRGKRGTLYQPGLCGDGV